MVLSQLLLSLLVSAARNYPLFQGFACTRFDARRTFVHCVELEVVTVVPRAFHHGFSIHDACFTIIVPPSDGGSRVALRGDSVILSLLPPKAFWN